MLKDINEFKEELKQKTDIVSVISRYMPLEKKGKTYWGLCPFHGEKTPSFAVNEQEQYFHCFGCHESGDVFTFVQKKENCSFHESIKILADWAGLKIPEFDSAVNEEKIKRKRDCLNALRECALFYHNCLNSDIGKDGKNYLTSRKVNDSLITLFGLGYCPDFDQTQKYLEEKGYETQILIDAGILKHGEKKLYDPMGQRVVFPIVNNYGEVVAFTGRTLKKKVDYAKYLNTSDTIVFSKGHNLYALNLIKKYQRQGERFDYFIIVEGNMDVISLHKAGFKMAIAGMGTALTIEQAKLIKRFVNKVYICYDGDSAGKKATMRGLEILKEQGLDVFVMQLPDGKDPDNIICEFGKTKFLELVENALPLVEYKLTVLADEYDLSNFDGKSKYATKALQILKSLNNDIEAEIYLPMVQKLSGTSKDFLRKKINQTIDSSSNEKLDVKNIEKNKSITDFSKAEKFLLSVIYHGIEKDLLNSKKLEINYFEKLFSPELEPLLCDINKGIKAETLINNYPEFKNLIAEVIVSDPSISKNLKVEINDCIKLLRKQFIIKRQKKLSELIDKEIDSAKREVLLSDLMKLTKELKTLQ